MTKCRFAQIAAIVALFCAVATVTSQAQTYNVLFDFNGSNGYGSASLTQGTDGNLYGTTDEGGKRYTNTYGGGEGTAFKITPTGSFTLLHKFCSQSNCADGIAPGSLTLGINGSFYGTTYAAGSGTGTMIGCGAGSCGGTFFEMTPAGNLTTLYSFCAQANCAMDRILAASEGRCSAPMAITMGPPTRAEAAIASTAAARSTR